VSALQILYADNHLLAVAKPAGLPMVADESGDPSLQELAKEWVREEKRKPGAVYLGVVHRLDRPVSGVALFARTSKAAERLSKAFRERAVRKIYWAITEGVPSEEQGELEQWLAKDPRTNRVRAIGARASGAQRALTRWRVLASEKRGPAGRAWIELEPETGRSHQLRVALSSLDAPILGDLKYGASRPLADRSIALHAQRLEIPQPTTGKPLVIECPLPPRAWWSLARRGP
jgi:23S rRNA pseudouridine1911/1915/1917 synthase